MKSISLFVFSSAILLFAASCKKTPPSSGTSCTSDLYGFSGGTGYPTAATLSSRTFGKINEATGSATSISTITNGLHSMKGAYNTGDNCYYAFKSNYYDRVLNTLYKVDMSGGITVITNSSADSISQGSLVYNRISNKLYCIKNVGSGSKLSEILISGSTFSLVNPVTTINKFDQFNATVDQGIGDIYYQTIDQSSGVVFKIEKYHPGASAPTLFSTVGSERIFGLSFNINDHMLYGIGNTNSSPAFVKINSSGVVTTVASITLELDEKFYSACIDPCNNHYVLSSVDFSTSTSHLYQLDMTGAIVTHVTPPVIYQGLDLKY